MKTYERWLFVNPDMDISVQTLPRGLALLGKSFTVNIHEVRVWLTKEEAQSCAKDVQALNPDLKLARVSIEFEEEGGE